jgi:hypothetical protein
MKQTDVVQKCEPEVLLVDPLLQRDWSVTFVASTAAATFLQCQTERCKRVAECLESQVELP